ncbi:MAG: SOS response-associated peptidase family protein [Caulobacter sp.]|nr:SOS response-associated peptidase family protein [Caulobacter sp.]
MCNNYANHIPPSEIFEIFSDHRLPLIFPDGPPNLEPNDDIRPTDAAPVILPASDHSILLRMKWGLTPSQPKRPPVINYRSEGRRFERGRCLVPASSFYEFTGDKYPKTRWRFSRADGQWFCFAGFHSGEGEAARFALLTCAPGPDIAPTHDRQPVVLERADWDRWLAGEDGLLTPSPAGTWTLAEAPRAAKGSLL